MQQAQIVYRGSKPKASEIAELKELIPTIESVYLKAHPGAFKTTIDPVYKIERLDWDWFRTLFDIDIDISCLVLEPDDLKEIGIKDHWGFYSLDTDTNHQFYMTNLGSRLDARAIKNGFKSNFAWMFVHEYLHGCRWAETHNKHKSAQDVHDWESQGTLRYHLAIYNLDYDKKSLLVTLYTKLLALLTLKKKPQKIAETVPLQNMKTLQIFRPLISSHITQHFGENGACTDRRGRITNARNGRCATGTQPFYQSLGMHGHNGIDVGALMGEDIYHGGTYDGWMKVEHDSGGGIGVDVVSNEPLYFAGAIPEALKATAVPIDGGYLHHVLIRYWHLKAPVGFDGKPVKCGTTIGLAGMSGAASGVHLHFAYKFCLKDGRSVDNDNGWNGAQNPEPFYNNNVTARDHAKYLLGGAPTPSAQEAKDMLAQLSLMQLTLVTLQKTIHNI